MFQFIFGFLILSITTLAQESSNDGAVRCYGCKKIVFHVDQNCPFSFLNGTYYGKQQQCLDDDNSYYRFIDKNNNDQQYFIYKVGKLYVVGDDLGNKDDSKYYGYCNAYKLINCTTNEKWFFNHEKNGKREWKNLGKVRIDLQKCEEQPTQTVSPIPEPSEWFTSIPRSTEWAASPLPTPKPTEWVPPPLLTTESTEWVPPPLLTSESSEWVTSPLPTPQPTQFVPLPVLTPRPTWAAPSLPTPKPTEWAAPPLPAPQPTAAPSLPTPKPTEWVAPPLPTPKPTKWVPPPLPTPKPTEWVAPPLPTPKPTEWVAPPLPTPKPTKWVPPPLPTPKPTEWVTPSTPKPTEWAQPSCEPSEQIPKPKCQDVDLSCEIISIEIKNGNGDGDKMNKLNGISGLYYRVSDKCENGYVFYRSYNILHNCYYYIYYDNKFYVISDDLGSKEKFYARCSPYGDISNCLDKNNWIFNNNNNNNIEFEVSLKRCPIKPTPFPTPRPSKPPTPKPTPHPTCPYKKCGNEETICRVAILNADECKSGELSSKYYWLPNQCWNNAPYYFSYSIKDGSKYYIYLHRKPCDPYSGPDVKDDYYYVIGKNLGGDKYYGYCKSEQLDKCLSNDNWYFNNDNNYNDQNLINDDKFVKLINMQLILTDCVSLEEPSKITTTTIPPKPSEWVTTTTSKPRECESSLDDNICLYNNNWKNKDEENMFGTYIYGGCYHNKPWYKHNNNEYIMYYDDNYYGITKKSLGHIFDYGFCMRSDLKSCCINKTWLFSSKKDKNWQRPDGLSLLNGPCSE